MFEQGRIKMEDFTVFLSESSEASRTKQLYLIEARGLKVISQERNSATVRGSQAEVEDLKKFRWVIAIETYDNFIKYVPRTEPKVPSFVEQTVPRQKGDFVITLTKGLITKNAYLAIIRFWNLEVISQTSDSIVVRGQDVDLDEFKNRNNWIASIDLIRENE
jgi:hypothetical protein